MAERVAIKTLGHAGDGIAETEGGRIFVPFALPGEEAEIEREGNRGKMLRLLAPSPDRTEPACPHFGTCGGCALQHLETSAYRAWKRGTVERSFALHGIEAPIDPIVATGPGGRRRAVFSVVRTMRGVVLGFNRRGSNEIVAIEECPVLAKAIVDRLDTLWEIAAAVLKPGRRGRIVVLAADNGLDIAITGGAEPDRRMIETLSRFSADPAIARLTVNESGIFMRERPSLRAGDAFLLPPPGGFVQASAEAEAAMAEAVLAHAAGAGPVADLFSGIGTFSLRLARQAPVLAVEGEADLLSALEQSVRRTTGLKPVATRRRDLFVNPVSARELNEFGAAVFDPPAAGAKAQAEQVAASRVPKVVAVSCNPATLARDARILIDGGYRLTRVVPIDQFLWSAEIEAVACFER